MCILFWTIDRNKTFPFILASNRDEFFSRPTQPAHFWSTSAGRLPEPTLPRTDLGGQSLGILSGLDIDGPASTDVRSTPGGGTWLGVTTTGRLSALTNFREAGVVKVVSGQRVSRGILVRDFLTGEQSPKEYVKELERASLKMLPLSQSVSSSVANSMVGNQPEDLRPDVSQMAGFNLICMDLKKALHHSTAPQHNEDVDWISYFTNRKSFKDTCHLMCFASHPSELGHVYGLSNANLDAPWPKVERGKEKFASIVTSSLSNAVTNQSPQDWNHEALSKEEMDEERRILRELFDLMGDTSPFSPCNPPKHEKDLVESICIPKLLVPSSDYYGTRSTTVVIVTRLGECIFAERLLPSSERQTQDGDLNEKEDWKLFRFPFQDNI